MGNNFTASRRNFCGSGGLCHSQTLRGKLSAGALIGINIYASTF